MKEPCVWIVVPCYNEEEVVSTTATILKLKLQKLINNDKVLDSSRILFVDDGSTDNTWILIENICKESVLCEGIKLSKNQGHQVALLSGYQEASKYADAAISIDADLQQDVEAIDNFISAYKSGYDIVYGIRNSRNTDSWVKRNTANLFYKIMSWLGGSTRNNCADYRLMSNKALRALIQYQETNLFLRGLIPNIGMKSTDVYFDVVERKFGESKYSFRKMISLALDGITSFSVKPIRLITGMGFLITIVSIVEILYSICVYLTGKPVSGWSSLIISIWLLSGLQLFSLGVIGEYIGRTYLETKKRPRYFIENSTIDEENGDK